MASASGNRHPCSGTSGGIDILSQTPEMSEAPWGVAGGGAGVAGEGRAMRVWRGNRRYVTEVHAGALEEG